MNNEDLLIQKRLKRDELYKQLNSIGKEITELEITITCERYNLKIGDSVKLFGDFHQHQLYKKTKDRKLFKCGEITVIHTCLDERDTPCITARYLEGKLKGKEYIMYSHWELNCENEDLTPYNPK